MSTSYNNSYLDADKGKSLAFDALEAIASFDGTEAHAHWLTETLFDLAAVDPLDSAVPSFAKVLLPVLAHGMGVEQGLGDIEGKHALYEHSEDGSNITYNCSTQHLTAWNRHEESFGAAVIGPLGWRGLGEALLARLVGKKHLSLFDLEKDHRADFVELGLVRFQTGEPTRGRPERFALLNEDQSYLLLTYTRNTERTRRFKVRLVKAFGEARWAAGQRQAEYLPTYRELHDELHTLAAGSTNRRHIHRSVNKLIN